MNTNRQVQQFKAERRKGLVKNRTAGKVRVKGLTLAAANIIKNQPLDVSRLEVLEHEIDPDN